MTLREYSDELKETIFRAKGALSCKDPKTAEKYLDETIQNVIKKHLEYGN